MCDPIQPMLPPTLLVCGGGRGPMYPMLLLPAPDAQGTSPKDAQGTSSCGADGGAGAMGGMEAFMLLE